MRDEQDSAPVVTRISIVVETSDGASRVFSGGQPELAQVEFMRPDLVGPVAGALPAVAPFLIAKSAPTRVQAELHSGPQSPITLSTSGPTVEHATEMSGGGMHVWNEHPTVARIWPTAERIAAEKANGARVWARRVLVLNGWERL